MLERLIESWLDSATERSYQSPFCQMLAGDGHLVVHSTQHTPIEFGKDIITIGPDGVPCAFQLKGHPGGRMTLTDFRDVRPQLTELVENPIAHPGVPRKRHRCYLVTNGQTDEVVQRALIDMNQDLESRGFGPHRIELWERGRLLEMATRLGASLWPSEIEDLNVFLDLLVHRGDDLLPLAKFHRLFQRILRLEETATKPLKVGELKRHITSAAMLTAVALRNFSAKDNHFATVSAWVMFSAYAISACERHGVRFASAAAKSVSIAKTEILDALASMCEEIRANEKLAPHTGLEIAPMYKARATLIYGLMSAYWLWASEEQSWPIKEHSEFLRSWLPKNFEGSYLWGEAAVPQFLAHYWFLSRTDASWNSERHQLASLVTGVIFLNLTQPHREFPGPYFSFEDCMKHKLATFLDTGDDPLRDESVRGTSFMAEGLLHLLVSANLKQTAKGLWPPFTQLGLMRFDPDQTWQYCLYRNDGGLNRMIQPSSTKAWTDLVEEARDCRGTGIPAALRAESFILLLFLLSMPYRATPDAIRFLGRQLGTAWFIPDPID